MPTPVRAEARGVVYDADRLYGAAAAFAQADGLLFNVRPRVVALSEPPITLELPGLDKVGLPKARQAYGSSGAPQPVKLYNPSVVAAPASLCPRCASAYAAATGV